MRRWLPLWILLCAGCGVGVQTSMINIPPPRDWESELRSARASKDEYFRSAAETPLAEGDVEGFEGLEYWDPDRKYYFVGSIQLYAEPQKLPLTTTAGQQRPGEKIGQISFRLDGRDLKLQVYRLLDIASDQGTGGLLLPFHDATTGKETYPAGRYVDLRGAPGGPYVLDFNSAYNPSCAYGAPERFACPVTPAENRLPVRISVGERGFKPAGGG